MASGLHCIVLLCLTSALWIGANAQWENPAGGCFCAHGWTQFGSRSFRFQKDAKDWADAERFCSSLGGNLASLRTKDDYKNIRELIFKATGKHTTSWVGGSDAVKEGVWLWSDGFKFDFKGWGRGEPNNFFGEHCMEINFSGHDNVNDKNCHEKKPFVCAGNAHQGMPYRR